MDNIEVELEEVKGLSKENLRLLEKMSRSMERDTEKTIKSAIKETISTMSGGSSGFLDQAIKSLTGGSKLGGALAAGGAAGLTAAAVMELVTVLKDMVKNSKIASTVQNQINSALGLLLDLVLLPFLPLLVFGIIQLYSAILGFGNWWKTVWDTIKKEGLIGLVKLGLQWIWDTLVAWEQALLKWLFGEETLGQKVVDLAIAFSTLLGGIFGYIGEKVIGTILDFIFGEGTYDKAKQAVLNILASLIDGGIAIIKPLIEFIFGIGTLTKTLIDFTINLLKSGLDLIWQFIEFILNISSFVIDFTVNLLKGAGGILWDIVSGISSGVASTLSTTGNILGFADGGTVPGGIGQPTLAVVHGGETITPAGQQNGGNTFHLYGLTSDQLQQQVKTILRQEGARYQS
jgi:phage-related protein